jgi:hypothetical protein
MIAKYQSGISTNQLMTEHHLAKRTISATLKANSVTLRRQGLTDKEAQQAAELYSAGRSLAWIATHFDWHLAHDCRVGRCATMAFRSDLDLVLADRTG